MLAIALNAVFVAIEFFYGFIANSTALMADAGHNLSDVLGLMLAWGAALLAKARRRAASPMACAARRSWRRCSTPCC
jgi:Co/Zn/Cd efflux system component